MIHRAVGAADQAEGLAGVVAVQAGPGAVGLGTELGGAAPARRRAELQAPVGDKAQHIGTRSPVPRAGQREQRLVDLWPRLPAVWQARLVVGHDPHQVEGDPADVGTRRGVGQGDGADAVGGAHAQRGQEARHRAGMAVQHPPVVAEQLQAEPVSAGPGLVAGRRGRRAHLGQRRRGQHPVVAVQQEDGEPAQVLRGRPELPRRRHQPGGIGRLELHDVRPRVHRETARVRLLGRQGGAGHGERAQDLLPQRVLPAVPAQLADQRAEQPVAGVGVVEQPPAGCGAGLRMSASPGRSSPGLRSHHGPGVSEARPAVCASSWAIVAPAASPASRCLPSGSARSRRPSSRSRMTSTAINVLVSEPMRNWVSPSGSCPASMLRDPNQAWPPSRTTAAASNGVRPSAWPTATRCVSARRVAGSSPAADSEDVVTVAP